MKIFTPGSINAALIALKNRQAIMWRSSGLLLAMLFTVFTAWSQTSVQNFGTGTGSQTSATASTSFIPAPTSGTTYARAGATAPAAPINLVTASNPLGTTGAYVRAVASATGSVCKMSPWVAYTGGTEFYTSFKVMFGDAGGGITATSGSWSFFQGAGAMYSDNNGFSSAQVFTGLTFSFGAGGAIGLQYRLAAAASTTGLSQTNFASGVAYTVEIVGNNKTSGTINYTYNGSAQSVAVQKFDLYINGTLIGNDLGEATLPANTSINSGTFIGINSTANVANIFVDDVNTYNAVPAAIGVSAPTVTTDAVPSAIGTTTGTLNGNVTSDGASTILARGIVFSETATNATPAIGGGGVTDASTSGTTGAFSVPVTPLLVNTQYSYRAYATNAIGTSYGGASGTTFYTLANTPNAPVVNNPTSSSLDVAVGAGDGNPAATQYAIQETGGQYVQGGGALGASPVWQTAATWATIAVTGLAPSTLYTFQVKARNGANTETAFGSTASGTTDAAVSPTLNGSVLAGFGNVCINTTAGPNTFTITGSALTTDPVTVGTLNGFSFSTDDITYTASLSITQPGGAFSQLVYVKFSPTLVQSYDGNIVVGGGGASNTNVPATGSGINTAASVTTGGSSLVTQVSATLNGTITSEGCSAVTAYGIEYSTSIGFANGTGTPVASGNISLGAFSSSVSGLSANTTYYYHAYATNSGGTSYGSEQNFITSGLDAPNATAATNVADDSFDANWDAVTGATSYRLDVSTSPTFGTTILATDLFISEYVEGSSNNKYVEIYNGTGASVNLADYRLRLYTNGASTPSSDVLLSGTLANGSTIVYKNASAAAYAGAATTNAAVNYNGDDAIALFKISTAANVDILGSIGEDPGTAWTAAGGYSTLDKTIVRKASVTGGVTTNPGTGFPTLSTEWDVFNIDDVTHLGAHSFTSFIPSFVPGYDNLTVNGTTQSVTGLTTNTTYHYRVRAFSTNSTSANSNTIDVTTTCSATVVSTSGSNGTVSPGGSIDYTCGDSPTYNIAPDACYNIVDVLVDGISQGPITSYTFSNIAAGEHTISATFVGVTYEISASSNGGGTISPNGPLVVNCGDDITYTITEDACFSIGDVFVDGISVGAVSTYTFSDVDNNHTIDVNFIPTPYTIVVTSGLHGEVSPGSGTADCGTDATYTITADDCYSIEDVLVDGVSVGAVSSYTFFNVQTTHTISATFIVNTNTITASAGANGSVTPAGASIVNCGSDNTYTITPAACYHVDDVLVDGVSVGAVTSYTFTNTTADHTISATFAINTALAAPVVTGITNVCPYIGTATSVTYTANSAGAVSYSWILPPNVVLQSSTTNSITVTFNSPFGTQANKQIKVTALSPCGNSTQVIYYLLSQAPGTPAPITGNVNVCSVIGTANTITYSVPQVLGATSYNWLAQAGTTNITFPNGTGVNGYTVQVSFTAGFTTSAITVTASNGCGTSGTRSLTLVKANPSTPSLISGPTNVCANIAPGGTAAAYSVTATAGVDYNWTVPAGVVDLTGQGTASISFTYPAGYTGGSISVQASNGCGASGTRSLSVTKLNPGAPSAIDVIMTSDCPNRIYTYSVASLPANATSLVWTIPAGASQSPLTASSISVTYPSTSISGTVTVKAVNNCGTSVTRSVNVNFPACPDGPPPPPPPPGPKAAPVTNIPVATMEVSVFPNPTVNDFRLKVVTAGKETIHVRITDMQGRALKQLIATPYQTINVGADLRAGSYMMEVRQGNTVKTVKVIKF